MPVTLPSPIVSTDWLAGQLGAPGLVVLDASWYLPSVGRDARAEYRAARLSGAIYFDLDDASDAASPLPHMVPSGAAFGAYVGGLGIGTDDAVVVYDGSGNNLSAARVWWLFRAFGHEAIALLDGGLGKWRAEGRPLEAGEASRPARPYRARREAVGVCGVEEIDSALASGEAQVVDMRSTGRFEGTEPEPRPGVPSGHMKGSVNLPFGDLVGPDGTMLPPGELEARVRRAGVDPARPVIATCGSGTSACNLLLALERLGVRGATLFDGSWMEWVARGRPIATGRAGP